MSADCETAPPLSGSRRPIPSRPGASLAVLAAAIAVGFAPLVVMHLRQIGERPYYQFYPFAFLAAAVAAGVRFRGFRPGQGGGTAAGATVGVALVGLAAAVVIGSSWLGYLSFLVAATGLVHAAAGWDGLRRAGPSLALLALLLPPPFDLDRELVLALRRWTTQWSGLVIDALAVPHLMAGNVVDLGHRRLMVEEACSGINSLYALMATALFFAAVFGRSLAHTVLLMASTAGWVVVANVTRVVAVVVAEHRGTHLADGWRHEALGIAVFVAAVLLMASTDRLFLEVAGRFAAWRARRAEARGEAADQLPEVPTPAPATGPWRPSLGWSAGATLVVAAAFVALGAAQLALAAPAAAATGSIVERLNRLTAESLPERMGDWRRAEFRSERRSPGSQFGEYSRVWLFSQGGTAALVSADCPYPGWHNPVPCYTSQGWTLATEGVEPAADGRPGFVRNQFERAGYQAGYHVFAEFGPTGELLEPRLSGARLSLRRQSTALRRLGYRLGLGPEPPRPEPAADVGQLQVFVQTGTPLSQEGRASVERMFAEALGVALARLQSDG